jgi:hypothetical protein
MDQTSYKLIKIDRLIVAVAGLVDQPVSVETEVLET